MGKPQRRKKSGHGDLANKKSFRTKKRTKDLDQILVDLVPEAVERLKNQQEDPDLPGLGKFYCVECARYFIDQTSLDEHTKSKVHKKRLKQLGDVYMGPTILIDNGKPIIRDNTTMDS